MTKCIHHDQCGTIEFINNNALQYECTQPELLAGVEGVERLCQNDLECQTTFNMSDVRCAAITSFDLPDLLMTKCVMNNKCGG